MQVYEDADEHCRGHTTKRGEKFMSIKWGIYIQLAGTIYSCHHVNLRAADKWSTPPPPDTKVITEVRRPARGEPYTLKFVLPCATEDDVATDLLETWLLPLMKKQQLAIGKRMGLSQTTGNMDPLFQSTSTSTDGAGPLLKAIRKWMALQYPKAGINAMLFIIYVHA